MRDPPQHLSFPSSLCSAVSALSAVNVYLLYTAATGRARACTGSDSMISSCHLRQKARICSSSSPYPTLVSLSDLDEPEDSFGVAVHVFVEGFVS